MAPRQSRVARVPGVQPHDRRFRRSRARGEQSPRQRWLARLWSATKIGVLVGLSGWALAFVYTMATASAWFTVRDLRVQGNQRLSTGEVSMLLDGLRGANVVVTSLEPWRERLMGSPWVKDASLRRVLPDAIDVTIVERRAAAIVRAGRTLQMMDAEGVLIDEYGPRYASLDLPLLEGINLARDAAPDQARTALAIDAIGELATAGMLWRVSQIDVSKPHDVVVTLNDDMTLLHLGDARFAERLQSYLDMARRLQAMATELEYVDLRFDDRVYIRPRRAGVTFASVAVATPATAQADVLETVEADVIPDDPSGQE
jgi:cell division protein FtsQ